MGIAVLVLALGYFTGGAVGDSVFRHTRRGRLMVATSAVLLGAVLPFFTLNVPLENQGTFLVLLSATALFIPFSSPNIVSTINDIGLPEVGSTALAVQYFVESGGSALAPWLAGVLAVGWSLRDATLVICISAWLLCAAALIVAAYLVPRNIETLRRQLRERAEAALGQG
jgi:MFS family permease